MMYSICKSVYRHSKSKDKKASRKAEKVLRKQVDHLWQCRKDGREDPQENL